MFTNADVFSFRLKIVSMTYHLSTMAEYHIGISVPPWFLLCQPVKSFVEDHTQGNRRTYPETKDQNKVMHQLFFCSTPSKTVLLKANIV